MILSPTPDPACNDPPLAPTPCPFPPGSPDKVGVLAERRQRGYHLWHPQDDAGPYLRRILACHLLLPPPRPRRWYECPPDDDG